MQKISERLDVDIADIPVKDLIYLFPVAEDMIEKIKTLKDHTILDSHLFKIFQKQDLPRSKKDLTLTEIYFQPVKSLAKFLWKLIKMQEVTFVELVQYFSSIQNIFEELKNCCRCLVDFQQFEDNSPNKLLSISNKIGSVIKSNQCLKFADDALKVQKKLELVGDFSKMDNLKIQVDFLNFFIY